MVLMLSLVSALKVKDLTIDKLTSTEKLNIENYFNINLKDKTNMAITDFKAVDYQIYHNIVFINILINKRQATWIMKLSRFENIK